MTLEAEEVSRRTAEVLARSDEVMARAAEIIKRGNAGLSGKPPAKPKHS